MLCRICVGVREFDCNSSHDERLERRLRLSLAARLVYLPPSEFAARCAASVPGSSTAQAASTPPTITPFQQHSGLLPHRQLRIGWYRLLRLFTRFRRS